MNEQPGRRSRWTGRNGPDVDAVYMTATQAMTGQGGWPMTVFMTPDREPFYCGTYFPRASSSSWCSRVAKAWREDRAGVDGQASRSRPRWPNAPRAAPARRPAGGRADTRRDVARAAAVSAWPASYDAAARRIRRRAQVPAVDGAGIPAPASERARAPAAPTRAGDGRAAPWRRWPAAACMTSSAAGSPGTAWTPAGWCRTSRRCSTTTRCWPRVYAHLWRRTGSPLARRVAGRPATGCSRELRTPEGGLASALDADSEGEEGTVLRLDPDELTEVLGAGGRRVRGGGVRRDRGRAPSSTAARCCSGAPSPHDPDRFDRVRAALLAAARAAGPAGPGRQGGRRLERAGHRRAGRGRAAARRAGPSWPRPRRAAELLAGCT